MKEKAVSRIQDRHISVHIVQDPLNPLYFYHLERDAIDLKEFEKEVRRRVGLQVSEGIDLVWAEDPWRPFSILRTDEDFLKFWDHAVPGGSHSTIWLLGNILYPKKIISPVRRSPRLRVVRRSPRLEAKAKVDKQQGTSTYKKLF